MSEHRLFGSVIVLLAIAAQAFWLIAIIGGEESFKAMLDGLGVEIIGAFVTALAVIGIERLYAKPDPQIDLFNKQVEQKNQQIALLQKRLRRIELQNRAQSRRARKPKGG